MGGSTQNQFASEGGDGNVSHSSHEVTAMLYSWCKMAAEKIFIFNSCSNIFLQTILQCVLGIVAAHLALNLVLQMSNGPLTACYLIK